MWRAWLDIRPTRTKLFDKGVLNSFSCQWCGDESETTSHVLWQCEFAQRIWNACPVPIPNECVGAMNFHDFISLCITALSHPNIEILFTTAWEIWNARNRQLWDNKSPVVDDIWRRAAGAAIDFLDVGLHVHEPGGVLDVDAFSRWRPPEAGNYKLNVGFSTDARKKLVGLGVNYSR